MTHPVRSRVESPLIIPPAARRELDWCDREIERMRAQHVGKPAWLVTLGIEDCEAEKRMILARVRVDQARLAFEVCVVLLVLAACFLMVRTIASLSSSEQPDGSVPPRTPAHSRFFDASASGKVHTFAHNANQGRG